MTNPVSPRRIIDALRKERDAMRPVIDAAVTRYTAKTVCTMTVIRCGCPECDELRNIEDVAVAEYLKERG